MTFFKGYDILLLTSYMKDFSAPFFDFLKSTTELLTSSLTVLAEKAGLLLTHLWVIFTKQQLILGLQELLSGIFLFVGGLISYRVLSKYRASKRMNALDRGVMMALFFILTLWFVIKGLSLSIDSLPRLLNPEYYALQESVQLLNQVKK